MDKIADNFKYFTSRHKEIYDAYSQYGKLIHEQGGPLDEKTRALLKIVISNQVNWFTSKSENCN